MPVIQKKARSNAVHSHKYLAEVGMDKRGAKQKYAKNSRFLDQLS